MTKIRKRHLEIGFDIDTKTKHADILISKSESIPNQIYNVIEDLLENKIKKKIEIETIRMLSDLKTYRLEALRDKYDWSDVNES